MDYFQNQQIQSVIPTQQNGYGSIPFNQPMNTPFVPQRNTPSVLPRKLVESIDVLRSIDIPFDGNVYYFPKADRSEVYTKRWLQNGTTEQLVYKLVSEETENKSNPINDIMEKLDGIEERIGKIEKSVVKPTNNNRNKKEESE